MIPWTGMDWQDAKFTEMAMHEKASRVGLTQNIEAAT